MDDYIYRTMVGVWTLVGLAWFAGVINNIQSKFEKGVDEYKVSADAPKFIQYRNQDTTNRNVNVSHWAKWHL